MTRSMNVVLAQPRGFCAGVVRAVEIVERALEQHGAPVYVRHEIVHNHHVVEALRGRGAVFVDEVDVIPEGSVTVFSAHGVARSVERQAARRGLDVIDATCPLVRRVHREGQRYAAAGYDVVLIGHAGHAEVEGSRGQIDGRLHVVGSVTEVEAIVVADAGRVAYVTQTTLSVNDTRDIIAALKRRFPTILGPDTADICYATQNRQTAVLAMVERVDMVLVIGSANSSNANRLREIGASMGKPCHLVEEADRIDPAWLEHVETLGLTAGASTPEYLVQQTLARLASWRNLDVSVMDGVHETAQFRLPQRLAAAPNRRERATA